MMNDPVGNTAHQPALYAGSPVGRHGNQVCMYVLGNVEDNIRHRTFLYDGSDRDMKFTYSIPYLVDLFFGFRLLFFMDPRSNRRLAVEKFIAREFHRQVSSRVEVASLPWDDIESDLSRGRRNYSR